MLRPLESVLPSAGEVARPEEVTSTYRGLCPVSGEVLTLPRTRLAEAVAGALQPSLPSTEGKMYGVLLVRSPDGTMGVLQAFSGKLSGSFHHPGWVPPMLDLEPTAREVATKARLAELKLELQGLSARIPSEELRRLEAEWEEREQNLRSLLAQRKAARRARREAGVSGAVLERESQTDSRLLREFKRERREALRPLQAVRQGLEREVAALRSERKRLSRDLQAELHERFEQGLWADAPWSLASLFPSGPPTGVGECCAPKLLHYAGRHNLAPLALAEFWWGESTGSRRRGEYYPACRARCRPLLGPLLSRALLSIEVVHEDEHLLVVNKPPGLLTVPGREWWNQDSLLFRLEKQYGGLYPVHRLDLETSGIVMFGRSRTAHSAAQKLFQRRRVEKIYHACLTGSPEPGRGRLSLPIERAEGGRYRAVSGGVSHSGWEAHTRYRLLSPADHRVEFLPLTGRSHQLRVHARYGLGYPIRGDRLYGDGRPGERLHLHAHRLRLKHPVLGTPLDLASPTPF